MPAPCTGQEFLDLVAQSKLVDEKSLSRYHPRGDRAAPARESPAELARALVRDELLTQFQAERLLLGTYRRFFFGRFKVLDQLGTGGMAQVYLCQHQHMHHRVAVKVLPPAKAREPSSLERFYREARAIAALNHPNIVRAYDIGQDDGLHFLVMEHVDGPSLLEMVIRHGPLHPHRVADYLRQAAHGLQHAFEAGLIHRDIKPANLVVDRAGTVKILDLGLARFFEDEQDNLSQEFNESVLGTADYLAPEQAEDSHKVDIRADIYSLGCTGYFCLTGNPPFNEGTFTQKLLWHQVRKPKPIQDYREDVPAELIAVIDRMMAKAPADRYQAPAEVVQALATIPNGVGSKQSWETAVIRKDATRKEPTPAPLRSARRERRWPLWVGSGVACLLLAGLITGLLLFSQRSATPPATDPRSADPRVVPQQPQVAALILHCGRGMGAQQEELIQSDFGYRLLRGMPWDEWPAPAARSYCWFDADRVQFQLQFPPGTAGTLRLRFVDGDSKSRKQRLLVGGKTICEIEDFTGAGKQVDVPLSPEETKEGTIEVAIEKVNQNAPNAVISTVELLIQPPGAQR